MIGSTDESLLPGTLWDAHRNVTVVGGNLKRVIELSETSAEFRALLPALLQTTKGITATSARFRRPFDVIIRCFGWNVSRQRQLSVFCLRGHSHLSCAPNELLDCDCRWTAVFSTLQSIYRWTRTLQPSTPSMTSQNLSAMLSLPNFLFHWNAGQSDREVK